MEQRGREGREEESEEVHGMRECTGRGRRERRGGEEVNEGKRSREWEEGSCCRPPQAVRGPYLLPPAIAHGLGDAELLL